MTEQLYESEYPVEFDPPAIVRRADWGGFAFQLMEDDNVTPINTTGYSAEMFIMESENGEVYLTLGTDAPHTGITMNASLGLFNVEMDADTVDTLDFRTAFYKLIVTDDDGGKTPFFAGRLVVR